MSIGTKLPPRRTLCKQLDCSRATIDKAINELKNDGFLSSQRGGRTYVSRRLDGVIPNCNNWCLIVPYTDRIYAQLIHAVKSAAQKINTNVIVCNSSFDPEKQSEYINRLIMAGVDGFIIVPVIAKNVLDSVSLYQSLINSNIPFVFCNRAVDGVDAPLVKSNDFYGGYLATLHLLSHGYKNIVFLAHIRYQTGLDRCQGYISALQQEKIEIIRKRILISDDDSIQNCCNILTALLQVDPTIDAVFCFNDQLAIEVIHAVQNMGLRISDDIGIIGYDDSEELTNMPQPLSTVSYRTDETGKLAAHILHKKITANEQSNFNYYLVEPHIIERSTCLGPKTKSN